MEEKTIKTKRSWSKLSRNIWIGNMGIFFITMLFSALLGESRNQNVLGGIILIVLVLFVLVGSISFCAWILLIMHKKLLKTLFITGGVLIGIFLLLLFIQNNLIGRSQIIGDTMKDYRDSNYYFICRLCKTIKRHDTVVFQSEQNPDTEKIGRIIGLPNETVEIEKEKVTVSGVLLNESYADWSTWVTDDKLKITLDGDSYFALTDKRFSPSETYSVESGVFSKKNYRGRFL